MAEDRDLQRERVVNPPERAVEREPLTRRDSTIDPAVSRENVVQGTGEPGTVTQRETVVRSEPVVEREETVRDDSHPVSTGVGMAGGALAGSAVGVVGGPVGMAVGAVVGGAVGAAAGNAAGESADPAQEDAWWRENYQREPYYVGGRSYDDYGPAYRYGVDARGRYQDWTTAEPELASGWENYRGGSSLSWNEARPATRAAWDRIETHQRTRSEKEA